MNDFVAEIEIKPMPKKRPVVTGKNTYMPPDYVAWKKDFGLQLKSALNRAKLEKFRGRIQMGIVFEKDKISVMISDTEDGRFGTADLDNLCGAVMDAAQDYGVIDNDRNVVALGATFGMKAT